MPWLLVSPGHQHPWYWLCKIDKFLSYTRKDFNYLCHVRVEEWCKVLRHFYIAYEKNITWRVRCFLDENASYIYIYIHPGSDSDVFIKTIRASDVWMHGTCRYLLTPCWCLQFTRRPVEQNIGINRWFLMAFPQVLARLARQAIFDVLVL